MSLQREDGQAWGLSGGGTLTVRTRVSFRISSQIAATGYIACAGVSSQHSPEAGIIIDKETKARATK